MHTILKNSFYLVAFLLIGILFPSCDPFGEKATGDYITQTFDVTDFHGIDLDVPANVTVRVDSVYRIEVTCEESAMPYLQVLESGGILHVYFENNVYDVDNMKITVSAPKWDEFNINGSGDVRVVDAVSGAALRADVSGSGNLKVEDADYQTARIDVSGSGNISLAGKADDFFCSVSGSGDVDAVYFPVEFARIDVSGSGNARVNVNEQLDVQISGSGDVYYQGNPQVNAQVSGSGKIKRL